MICAVFCEGGGAHKKGTDMFLFVGSEYWSHRLCSPGKGVIALLALIIRYCKCVGTREKVCPSMISLLELTLKGVV